MAERNIGEYRLNEIYNEDCYESIKKIPDKSIDLIVTDPPFVYDGNMNKKTGYGCFKGRNKTIYDEIYDKNLDNNDYLSILEDFVRVMKSINIYIWCSKNQIKPLMDFFIDKHNCNYDILIWNKTNCPPFFNNSYLTDKEYCLYFRKGGYCNPKNYNEAKTIFTSGTNKSDKDLFEHPTIKPLDFVKTMIKNSSSDNQLILDTFVGSGTTCVAAKELNRQYIGFEIDKNFYDIAKNRLNGITSNGQQSIFTNFEQESLVFEEGDLSA